jgi:hypothetical protein
MVFLTENHKKKMEQTNKKQIIIGCILIVAFVVWVESVVKRNLKQNELQFELPLFIQEDKIYILEDSIKAIENRIVQDVERLDFYYLLLDINKQRIDSLRRNNE